MGLNARYVHTNLVAADWRRLARFYEELFDCRSVPPESALAGEWLHQATGIPDVEIHGAHLRRRPVAFCAFDYHAA